MELGAEVEGFLMGNDPQLANVLNDVTWVCKLAYLSDLISKMDEINLSLQGETIAVFKETTMSLLLREILCIVWNV